MKETNITDPNDFIIKNGVLRKYKGKAKSVVIPSSVVEIDRCAFDARYDLTSITIPSSVWEISSYFVRNCPNLESIQVSPKNEDFKSIGGVLYTKSGALVKCPAGFKKSSIVIPDSVSVIYEEAFDSCVNLTSVTFPKSIEDLYCPFLCCPNLESFVVPPDSEHLRVVDGILYCDDTLVKCPTKIDRTHVVIPDGIDVISGFAFHECSGLTSITIPDSVTRIGESAFRLCSDLTSLYIPDSVERGCLYALNGCQKLTSLSIPKRLLGERLCWDYTSLESLTSFTVRDVLTVEPIENRPGLSRITFNHPSFSLKGYTHLPAHAFMSIQLMSKEVSFEGLQVESIELSPECEHLKLIDGALYDSSGKRLVKCLVDCTSYTFPDSVTAIGESAFEGCSGLTSISIPDSVTEIRNGAFEGCTSLTSITIPDSVTEIRNGAFEGCTSLTSITIPDSIRWIASDAFKGCTSLTSITIPDSVTEIRNGAFEGCTSLTSITIPDLVTEIWKGAFKGCTGLTSISIPSSVRRISAEAFANCTGLTSITLPDGMWSIEDNAFAGCTGLTSISIPTSVEEIGKSAFNGCTGLTTVSFTGKVKRVAKNAFAKSKVKVVYAPADSFDTIRAAFSAKVEFKVLDESTKNSSTEKASMKKESSISMSGIGKSGKVAVKIEGIVSRARLQHMSNSDAAKAKKAIAALGSSKFSEVKKAGLVGDGELFYDAEETETFIVKVNSLSLDGQDFNPDKICCSADKVLACPVPVHEPGVYWAALHEVCYDGREGGIIVQFDQYPEAEPRTYTCEIELGEGEEFDISKLSFGPAYNPCLDSRHKYTGKNDVYINPNSLTYNGKEYVLQSDPAFDEDDFADAGLYHELEIGFVEVEKTESGTLTYKVIKGWTGDYNLKRYDVD